MHTMRHQARRTTGLSSLVGRDVGEAYQAETEASGDKTKSSVNRSEARPRLWSSLPRRDGGVCIEIFLWAWVSEMIQQSVKGKHRNEIIRYVTTIMNKLAIEDLHQIIIQV